MSRRATAAANTNAPVDRPAADAPPTDAVGVGDVLAGGQFIRKPPIVPMGAGAVMAAHVRGPAPDSVNCTTPAPWFTVHPVAGAAIPTDTYREPVPVPESHVATTYPDTAPREMAVHTPGTRLISGSVEHVLSPR